MKKFCVKATGTEMLATRVILAERASEAEEKYVDLWTAGQIEACDYELNCTVSEGEGDER